MTAVMLNTNHVPALNGVALHQSEIGTYKACRRQWHWSGLTRGGLEPAIKYAPFFTGSAVHYVIERFWGYNAPWEQSLQTFLDNEPTLPPEDSRWSEEQALIDDQLAIIRGMMPHYYEWENRQDRLYAHAPLTQPYARANFDVLTVEQEFSVPIIHPITGEVHPRAHFAGKWDAILRHRKTGKIYIGEYKTTRAIPSRAKMLATEDQTTYYMLAAKHLFGANVDGMLYTLIRKAVPPMPKVLDSGLLSGSVTGQTIDSYVVWIKKHHAPTIEAMVKSGAAATEEEAVGMIINEHYLKTLIKLNQEENTYFQRHMIRRGDMSLREGALELWDIANEMTDPNIPIYRTPKDHCNYCAFRTPCIMKSDGVAAFELVLQTNYSRRKHADLVTDD
jgi:hypothetical protein